jgi:fibronectin type 3 domain-containing protein
MGRALAVLVVLLLCLGPMVQAIEVGEVEGIPEVQDDGGSSIRTEVTSKPGQLLSDIDGFFTENKGQLGAGAGLYYCRGSPLSVAFGAGWVAYDLQDEGDEGVLFRMTFECANVVEPVGVDRLPHRSNYFIGNDPDGWIQGARNFREVIYPGLYDGIDLRYRFEDGKLKYDYIVAPGADHESIQLTYEGIEGLVVEEGTGDLLIHTAAGTIRDEAPKTFQDGPHGSSEVVSAFRLIGDRTVAFDLGDYHPELLLVIDPGVVFSTYIGGSGTDPTYDFRFGSTVDGDGNVFITGSTNSVDFPTTPGTYDSAANGLIDSFVLKLKSDGSDLEFSTYIGGSAFDRMRGIEVGPSGNIFVCGGSNSSDFPTTAGVIERTNQGGYDGVVVKLDSNGSKILFSTFYGGSLNDIFDRAHVDDLGSVLLAGFTRSNDLPMVIGGYDTVANGDGEIMIIRVNINATKLLSSSYIGGSGNDESPRMHVDGAGSIYLVGLTGSADFPVTLGAFQTVHKGPYDAFVMKMDSNITKLTYSTFLGGTRFDQVESLYVDSFGRAVVGGSTTSVDFPTTANAYDTTYDLDPDAIIAVLNRTGKKLDYGTYISVPAGASGGVEMCVGVGPEDGKTFRFVLSTNNEDLPVENKTHKGDYDFYIGRLNTTGKRINNGTYIGGSGEDRPNMAIFGSSAVTIVGYSKSTDFPTTIGAYSGQNSGGRDIMVLRYSMGAINGTRPTEPSNLSAVAGDRYVNLTWDPPMDSGGLSFLYWVYRGETESSLQVSATIGASYNEYNDTELQAEQTYYYAVSAINLKGESNRSNMVNATPVGPPGRPMLTSSPGCGTVFLEWTAPEKTGGLPLDGFRLFRGESIIDIRTPVYDGTGTEFNDTGLENGKVYHYRLSAYNAVGEGPLSDAVSAGPQGPPTEPWLLKARAGPEEVVLEWRSPLNEGGVALMGYRVYRGQTEDSLQLHETLNGFALSFKDTGLTNGQTYFYAVQAFNGVGAGPLSQVVYAMPLDVPGTPRNLMIAGGDGELTLTWERPEREGGTPDIGYLVRRGTEEGSVDEIIGNLTETTYTDQGLTNGRRYYYRT